MFKPQYTGLALAAILAAVGTTPVQADNIDGWLATYICSSSKVLRKIEIRKDDKGVVKVHAFGVGYPDDVDWGESVAEVYQSRDGGPFRLIVKYSLPKAKSMFVFAPNSGGGKPGAGGLARTELFTTFTDGRQPEYLDQQFETPPAK